MANAALPAPDHVSFASLDRDAAGAPPPFRVAVAFLPRLRRVAARGRQVAAWHACRHSHRRARRLDAGTVVRGEAWRPPMTQYARCCANACRRRRRRSRHDLTSDTRIFPWTTNLPTAWSSSPERRKASASPCAEAFVRAGAKVALVSRSRENLDAALARLPRTTNPPDAIVADLRNADDAARMADDAQANLGPIDVLVNSAGAAKRLCTGRLVGASVARCDGREVLQLHPADRHHHQVDGRARSRRHRQHHRHGRQGRQVRSICRAAPPTPR